MLICVYVSVYNIMTLCMCIILWMSVSACTRVCVCVCVCVSIKSIFYYVNFCYPQNSTSWVLSNLAALYWRVVGQGQLAIKCLKHSLYYSNEYTRVSLPTQFLNLSYVEFNVDSAK